ncbi:MAG: hypothetical protein MPL62_00445 [Alphaproteobacteria bacterium]|nr:hypothetical protein [Alphaproteobacteria bacterium]
MPAGAACKKINFNGQITDRQTGSGFPVFLISRRVVAKLMLTNAGGAIIVVITVTAPCAFAAAA